MLTDETAIYQRSTLDGHKTFKNWGRGVAWYLLGTIKTYKHIKDNKLENLQGIKALMDSFTKLSRMVLGHQNEKGMWMAYTDRKETGVDTSATAGIAAAFAWGVKYELLEQNYLSHARMAYQGLQEYISADGFVRNATQINRGGEELQASGYRVITQFSIGLMAQLRAAMD
jgi:rhamnogalacturonyl hydrolase YesR